MKEPIGVEDIIEAFYWHRKAILKSKEIKDFIFEDRGGSFGHQSRYTFDQTIQRKIEDHCPDCKGFKGKAILKKEKRAHYSLCPEYQYLPVKMPEVTISLKPNEGLSYDELEGAFRKRREINSIQRDSSIVIELKKLYDNQCQLCETKLQVDEDNWYSEVHHIRPLGEPHNGSDTASNMIVVCPNCHVLLDFHAIELNDIHVKESHSIDKSYLKYHNDLYIKKYEQHKTF